LKSQDLPTRHRYRLLPVQIPYQVMARGLVLSLLFGAGVEARQSPVVAAAASLRQVMPVLLAAYGREGGPEPRVVYGSSGNLYRQIRQGAPYRLFLSADENYVLQLAGDGFAKDRGTVYGYGHLALLVRTDGPLGPAPDLAGLGRALRSGTLRRFAIPNPGHAPYGKAAKALLVQAGLWESLRGRLVTGENAAQAAQFVVAGGADGALVPLSLVKGGKLPATPRGWRGGWRNGWCLSASPMPLVCGFMIFCKVPLPGGFLSAMGCRVVKR